MVTLTILPFGGMRKGMTFISLHRRHSRAVEHRASIAVRELVDGSRQVGFASPGYKLEGCYRVQSMSSLAPPARAGVRAA